jgi:hypothetical protein
VVRSGMCGGAQSFLEALRRELVTESSTVLPKKE